MDSFNYNKKHTKGNVFLYFIVGIIGAIIGGFLVLTFAPSALIERVVPKETQAIEDNVKETNQSVIITQDSNVPLISAIAKKVMPAVVGIRTTKYNENMFFGKTKVEGVGSGVIVDKKGYILTNNHVADSSSSITVYIADGRSFPSKVIWTDSGLDISIIKIEAENLSAAEIGDSNILEVGELAVAIGNPLGLRFERSVTAGIISALNRSIPVEQDRFMEDLIQTDASINSGNSGGPLINKEGRIIGINTLKAGGAEGMGFAIPINIASPIIKSIVDTGKFITPYIGITGLDKEIASIYDYKVTKGIYIANIDKAGPAYKAGLRKEDIILSINDMEINTLTSLKQAIFSAGVDTNITIKYQTKAVVNTAIVKLEAYVEK